MRDITLKITPERRNIEAAVHKQLRRINFSRFLMLVVSALFKPRKAYPVQEDARLFKHLNIFQQRLALVLRDKLPRIKAVVVKGIAYSVIIASAYKRIVLVKFLNLLLDIPFVIVGNFGDIQLMPTIATRPLVSNGVILPTQWLGLSET